MVEQLIRNQQVAGSNPIAGSMFTDIRFFGCAYSVHAGKLSDYFAAVSLSSELLYS